MKQAIGTIAGVLLWQVAPPVRAQEAKPVVSTVPARPVIATASELPRHDYLLPRKPSAMLDDPAAIASLAEAIDRNAATTLATYDIRDSFARRQLLAARTSAALLRGDVAAAGRFDAEAAALQDKEAMRLTAAIESDGWVAAARVAPGGEPAAFGAAVTRGLDRLTPALRPRVIELRRRVDLTSSAYARGEIAVYADPVWQAGKPIGGRYAEWLIEVAADERVKWRHRPAFRQALTAWLDAHPPAAGSDIWPARSIDLTGRRGLTPVGVSVWDVGVDRSVFRGTNDVSSSLAFDTEWREVEGDLKPVPPAIAPRLAMYERYMRGIGLLGEGRDGPDADYARALIAGLKPGDVAAFEEGYRFYPSYIHGTHVAGVAAAGDPAIRIVPVRITFSDAALPPTPDEGLIARQLDAARVTIAFMKANNVRVANMSWGVTGEDIEFALAANNVEPDPAKRTARAQALFDALFKGMSALMAEAPEILFVIAAGNANQDLDFVRDMPGSINLPNVLSVGAVDRAGKLTSFASTGRSVDLYALGYNIESFVPGGGRIVWSGASLSAPQVVNAAAKMLTIDPTLTTPQVVALLRETATRSPEGLPLLDARTVVERVTKKRGARR